MKITDVTLTLFAWDQIPATRYSANTGRFSGSSDLGLLTVATDQGIEGNAFLGSAWSPASQDGPKLIRYLKPLLLEKNPLERERLYQAMWSRSRVASIPAIGAIDVALWDIAGKVAGMPIHCLLGTYRHSAPAYASSQVLSTGSRITWSRHFTSRNKDGRRTKSIRRKHPGRPMSRFAVPSARRWAVIIA